MAEEKRIIVELSTEATEEEVDAVMWLIKSGLSKGDYGLTGEEVTDVRYEEFE